MIQNNGIVDILINEINKKWDSVRDLNSIVLNLQDEGLTDMIPIIEEISKEENNHIGQLQQLIEMISPDTKEIEDGKEEVLDIVDDTDFIGESLILDESLFGVNLKESIQYEIAREQLKKYREGKMMHWNPNKYLDDLVNQGKISEEEADELLKNYIKG